MAPKGQSVSEATLGAWLVKARPAGLSMSELLRTGFGTITRRCVRPTYRVRLLRARQPVPLRVSGGDPDQLAGIYAAGNTDGPPAYDGTDDPLDPLDNAGVPAIGHAGGDQGRDRGRPVLRQIEVVTMPAGSNPSYVDKAHYAALAETFPQLQAAEASRQ